MKTIRKRDIHGLHLGIRQQRLVARVRLGNPIRLGRLLGDPFVPGRDGDDLGPGIRSCRVEQGGRVDHGG
jgi:hypothetical protein